MAVMRRSILAIEDLNESEGFREVLRELLVFALERGLGFCRDRRRRALTPRRRLSIAIRLKMSARNFLELAGEPHDVHQRRAQIVADDIGEALDFGCWPLRRSAVRSSTVASRLTLLSAQTAASAASRARAERRTRKDRDRGQRDHETRSRRRSPATPASGSSRR